MMIEILVPWLEYETGDHVECAPNEAEWLIRTGRGKEISDADQAAENAEG